MLFVQCDDLLMYHWRFDIVKEDSCAIRLLHLQCYGKGNMQQNGKMYSWTSYKYMWQKQPSLIQNMCIHYLLCQTTIRSNLAFCILPKDNFRDWTAKPALPLQPLAAQALDEMKGNLYLHEIADNSSLRTTNVSLMMVVQEKSRGSPKLVRSIFWRPWMSVPNVMAWPKWWTDRNSVQWSGWCYICNAKYLLMQISCM